MPVTSARNSSVVPSSGVTVSALSDRGLAQPANNVRRVIELRRGGQALGGSYLYEGEGLITGWHSHEVHQIEYAIGGVVEVETASAHYLLPPQQAAWIPAGLEHQTTMAPDVCTVAVMFDAQMIPTGGVNLDTTADFLKAGACAVAVGGELIDAATIKEGKYEVFEERAKQYLEIVRKTRSELGAKAAAR